MATKSKGPKKMTEQAKPPVMEIKTDAPKVEETTTTTATDATTEDNAGSADTATTNTSLDVGTADTLTNETPAEAVKSGVVVAKTSSPAGMEAPAAVKAAVAAQTTAIPTNNKSTFEKMIAKAMDAGSGREKSVVTSLRNYVENMKPGKIMSPDEGAKIQANLFRTFVTVTRHDDQFKECMDLFIAFFKEYKDDVFHERYVFRFMESMTLASEQINAFSSMVNLLKIASTVGKGGTKKHVDLNRTMNEAYAEDQRQRVINYFS